MFGVFLNDRLLTSSPPFFGRSNQPTARIRTQRANAAPPKRKRRQANVLGYVPFSKSRRHAQLASALTSPAEAQRASEDSSATVSPFDRPPSNRRQRMSVPLPRTRLAVAIESTSTVIGESLTPPTSGTWSPNLESHTSAPQSVPVALGYRVTHPAGRALNSLGAARRGWCQPSVQVAPRIAYTQVVQRTQPGTSRQGHTTLTRLPGVPGENHSTAAVQRPRSPAMAGPSGERSQVYTAPLRCSCCELGCNRCRSAGHGSIRNPSFPTTAVFIGPSGPVATSSCSSSQPEPTSSRGSGVQPTHVSI